MNFGDTNTLNFKNKQNYDVKEKHMTLMNSPDGFSSYTKFHKKKHAKNQHLHQRIVTTLKKNVQRCI